MVHAVEQACGVELLEDGGEAVGALGVLHATGWLVREVDLVRAERDGHDAASVLVLRIVVLPSLSSFVAQPRAPRPTRQLPLGRIAARLSYHRVMATGAGLLR
jgi:hypothetical protein